MKKIIVLAAAGLFLCSCGSVRKVTSSSEQKSDSTAVTRSEAKKDSAASNTAAKQHTKTTTATVDTTVTAPGDSLAGGLSIDTQSKQPQSNTIESSGMKIETTYDPFSGKVQVKATAKPQTIPVQLHTQTVEQSTEQTSSTVAVSGHEEAIQEVTTSSSAKSEAKDVRREPPMWLKLWWLWLLLIAGIAYIVWKKYPGLWRTVLKFVLP